MPKPTAIRLTKNNVQLISEALHLDGDYVSEKLFDETPIYFVRNARLFKALVPYLIYTEPEFLRDFASVPPDIEDHFVPVTQVKE